MLNYEYPPLGGGAAPVTRAMAEQLVAAQHVVDVVTMGFRGLPSFEDHGGLRVYRVPAIRRSLVRAGTLEMFSYLPSALVRSRQLVRSRAYDVIHSHFVMPTSAVAVVLRWMTGLPSVVTLHGSDVPGYNPDRFTLGHRLLAPGWRGLVRRADAIVSPTAFLRDLLQAHCDVPVDVIPHGYAASPPSDAPRQRRILVVTRLFPRKGVQFLLDGLAGMALGGWEVVVAGDGPALPELQAQARRLGVPVRFVGFVKGAALEELYATSAIFVFPSLQDNFPVVLLEAMSAGCAVVTTAVSGMPEVIGDAGVLVPPADAAAIRGAVERLMADASLRAVLGERARRRLVDFTWESVLSRYVSVYERVIRQSAGRVVGRGMHGGA